MPIIKNRTSIKIKGKTYHIDSYFTNALSFKYFDKPYSESNKETNEKIRELTQDIEDLSPQIIERAIFSDFFTKKVRNSLKKVALL